MNRPLKRFKSLLSTPAAAGVLALALLFDWMALPRHSASGYFAGMVERPILRVYIARPDADGSIKVLPTYDIAIGDAAQDAVGALWFQERERGAWALTRTEHVFTLNPAFGVLSDAELGQVRKALTARFMDPADTEFSPERARAIAASDMRHTQIIWAGWVHNAISLGVLALLACSLRSAPSWKEKALARQRLREGLCPHCRYNLAGLTGARCPECGGQLGAPPPPRREPEAG